MLESFNEHTRELLHHRNESFSLLGSVSHTMNDTFLRWNCCASSVSIHLILFPLDVIFWWCCTVPLFWWWMFKEDNKSQFLFYFYRHIASFLSIFKLLVIGVIIIGRDPFALFGMQAPAIWEWGQGNKVSFTQNHPSHQGWTTGHDAQFCCFDCLLISIFKNDPYLMSTFTRAKCKIMQNRNGKYNFQNFFLGTCTILFPI